MQSCFRFILTEMWVLQVDIETVYRGVIQSRMTHTNHHQELPGRFILSFLQEVSGEWLLSSPAVYRQSSP